MNQRIAHTRQDSDLFGLIYGFRFRPGERGQEIDSATALDCLHTPQDPEAFIWLHLNLAHAACQRWMKSNLELPEEFFQALHEGSRSTRIEHVDASLLAVVNDVVFDFGMVSSDISTLWVCTRSHLMISARQQPLHSVDRLRHSVKRGECFRSPLELLTHLLRDQGEVLEQIVRKTTLSVDKIEDQLLSSRLSDNRADLGAMRRVLVRLQRLLALEPSSLMRVLNRPPAWLLDADVQELRQSTDESALVISDLIALGERIKLLQEEIAAKLNEQSNRTLFTLTVVTVLALPINIIAGFFGMNVGGIPLATDPEGFWVLVALVATFTLLAGRWAFRKRDVF
ncbi:transporter [Pseudomonas sp. CCI3.2]|uniref:transporter n=1 Tax=unclassified Pseudomonas TaxID=196821 RepID=UPI002AC9C2D4|nr:MULTISPECIES: transporter [unclassified Pseudomonas]MEB0077488.1 transporter [Pseudomonas sp. MH10out]MEB0102605.1 transporter [Pseudomonas sp. CCI3.2]MEB0133286.1 transporter [Pseudomonas sp. CCI2.4]MEB0160454.1 transporter [Pseudomonas sp. AH2 (2023)]MEB0167900.1 transporter [Pseudomonas sp. CCC4.4]